MYLVPIFERHFSLLFISFLGLYFPFLRLEAQETPDKIAFIKFLQERTKTLDIYDQDGAWIDTKRVSEFDDVGFSFKYESCESSDWGDQHKVLKTETQEIILSPLGEGTHDNRIQAKFTAMFFDEISGETLEWPVIVSFRREKNGFRIMTIKDEDNGIHWQKINGWWHRPETVAGYRLKKKYKEYLRCHEDFSEFEKEPWGYKFPHLGNVKHFFVRSADGAISFMSDTSRIRLVIPDETKGFDETINYELNDETLLARFVYQEEKDGQVQEDLLKLRFKESGAGVMISEIQNSNQGFYWRQLTEGFWTTNPLMGSSLLKEGETFEGAFEAFLESKKIKETPEIDYQFDYWVDEIHVYGENGEILRLDSQPKQALSAGLKAKTSGSLVYFPILSDSFSGAKELYTLVFAKSDSGFSLIKAYDELGKEVFPGE